MAHLTFKHQHVKVDNAAGTLTDISGSVNSVSFDGDLNVLEDTGIGDTEGTYVPGVARGTITINGFINTTTGAIFRPLSGAHTSVTKTIETMQQTGAMFMNGEAYPTTVSIAGAPDTIQTFAATFQASGGFNSTSVSL